MDRHRDEDERRLRLGRAIERHRKARAMSQEALEAASGVSQSSISQWQRGRRGVPNVNHVARLEEALGLRPGTLLIEAGFVEMPTTTVEMIRADKALSPERREDLVAMYRVQAARSSELADATADLASDGVGGGVDSASTTNSAAPSTRRRKSARA